MKKKRKGKGGRKTPGVKTSITRRDTPTDIRARLFHGQRGSLDYLSVRLRELIGDGSKLPDNFLSARAAANAETARQKRYVLRDEIDTHWNKFLAQFERAVLDGDAEWFERQARAIRHGDKRTDTQKDRGRFEAEVFRLLTVDCVLARDRDKRTDVQKILKCFNQRPETEPLTEKEKRDIRELEQSYKHAVVEDMIGKSYTRKDGELIAVSRGGGALIVEWTLGQRRYSYRFKNRRSLRDTVRDIAKLRRR